MRLITLSSLVAMLFITALSVQAENPLDEYTQFSASANGGPLNWKQMKIYRSGNQMRGEYVAENEIRIAYEKTRNGWVIRPLNWVGKPKQCLKMSLLDISSYPFFAYTPDRFHLERTATAEINEAIDGHSCKVQEYAVKQNEGGPDIMMTLWRADDLKGFPVKIRIKPISGRTFEITYSDVKIAPPDAKLFQLPPLCGAGKRAPNKQTGGVSKTPAAKSPAPKKP